MADFPRQVWWLALWISGAPVSGWGMPFCPLPQELPHEWKLNLSNVSPVSAAFPRFVHVADD